MGVKMDDNEVNKNSGNSKFDELFKDEYAVILLQGRNSFGDMIYSYVEVTMPNIKRLYAALSSGEDFSPSDFGTIVASGKGVPPENLRNEMASNNSMLQSVAPTVFPPAAKNQNLTLEKKAWDEY